MEKEKREIAVDYIPHKPARPMKFVKDKNGNGWLCDFDVDPNEDLEKQGYWRCDEMAFPAGGR